MNKLINSLLVRVMLVLATTWVAAGMIPLVFRENQTILPVALKWAVLAGIGLVAGMVARWLLSERVLASRLLNISRALTAFVALSSSLWLAGWLTQGYVGFVLFTFSPSDVNWDGLGQLALGSFSGWLVLRAWRVSPSSQKAVRKSSTRQTRLPAPIFLKGKPRKTIKPGRSVKPRKPNKQVVAPKRKPSVAPRPQLLRPQRKFWAGQWARLNHRLQSLRNASQMMQSRLISSGQAMQTRLRSRLAPKPEEKVIQLQDRPFKAQAAKSDDSSIRMIGEMEHRCPYCLEVVEKNDPRGVRVCPICHTRHHADCWMVTGVCQVPHHHE